MMTVRDLMERLEDMDPDAEVRLMIQRHYPLESTVLGICDSKELRRDPEEGDEEEGEEEDDDAETIVYIVEGSQVGYGLKTAWNCAS
jgi:hypothetical protein